MVRGLVALMAMLIAGSFSSLAVAQSAPAGGGQGATANTPVLIPVTNSAKDVEITVAKLLKEQLKIESSLKLVNDNPDNLRLQIAIGADAKQNVPRLVAVVDTAVMARDKDGNAVSQAISVASTADISFSQDKMEKLLRWANVWNARMLPIRVFVADNRVYTATTVLGTITEPTTSDRVIGSFLGVLRSWPAVIRDLQTLELAPKKVTK